jgi:hypothetical protein
MLVVCTVYVNWMNLRESPDLMSDRTEQSVRRKTIKIKEDVMEWGIVMAYS